VDEVYASLGDLVSQGELLANLEATSLPQNVILAQAELINAQRALDELRTSQVQSAQAQQAVEQASQALEDARDPALVQSQAQTALAEAQQALEEAERNYEIIAKPASQSAIDQTKANLLLAENRLNDTLQQIDRIQRRASRPEDKMMFFESRELYEQILEGLELKEIQDRRSYEDSLSRYNRLIEPPNPNDLAVAEAALALGFHISISGIVTFKNALQIKEVASFVPLDRLLVETDAPYLAPVPHRGKLNHPALVRHVAEEVAKLKGISLEALTEATTNNFFRLFGVEINA